jgi:nucleoside-diphosphate-sugar epimerase
MSDTANTLLPSRKAIVLGAKGGFGQAAAHALAAKGWTVTGMVRDPGKARLGKPYASLVAGDALDARSVRDAVAGHDLIVYAVNPPYPKWTAEAAPMLANAIAAAREAKAAILFPGNIYSFGPDAGFELSETLAQNPITKKGAIRVEMERMLKAAAKDGVTTLVVRCGDFFGPAANSSWFVAGLLGGKGLAAKSIGYPGDPALMHSWAYLPDAGEAAARLVEKALVEKRLAPGFHAFGFPGHFIDGPAMVDAIQAALPKRLPVKSFPWGLLQLVRPFVPMVRELFEMRYLWQAPHRIDGTALEAVIGPVPATPLADAVRATIASMR